MRIGIDFDNTIAGYDRVFVELAAEFGLPPQAAGKTEIRDHLRARGEEGEITWQHMQAAAYGPRMSQAELFDGVQEFLAAARAQGADLFLVSHKTRYARRDVERMWDMRAGAIAWMEDKELFGATRLDPAFAFFEDTRDAKVARIDALGCDVFIDDLEEVLEHPSFPVDVARHLFAPKGASADATRSYPVHRTWGEIYAGILGL